MIDEQQLFDRFHAAFDVEPRAGMRDRIRAKLVIAGSNHTRSTGRPWTVWSLPIGQATRRRPEVLALVAALLVVLLVAGLLLVVNALHRPQTTPATPRAAGTAVLPIDERWYWSAADAAVLVEPSAGDDFPFPTIEITHDSGRTWTVTTFEGIGIVPVLRWFDAQHLILYSEFDGAYTTADGGDHWIWKTFSQPPRVDLTFFLSAEEGWTLCPTTAGCQSGTGPAGDYTLYHTTDAGSHWLSLAHGFSQSGVGPSGLVFTDQTHGFVSTYTTGGLGALYVTADGGRTWQLAHLPAAVGETATQVPVMFGKQGVLVVGTTDAEFTYTTNDNGRSWGNPRPLPGRRFQSGPCCGAYFFTADAWHDWWTVDGAGALFESTDQGGTWRQLPVVLGRGLVFGSVIAVGGHVLWGGAVAADGHIQGGFLVRSVDGGATWSLVKLAVARPTVYPQQTPTPVPQPCGIWTGTDRCPSAGSG